MVDTGWIKLHRKLLKNPIFRNPNLSHLFIYLLLRACHKEEHVITGNQTVSLRPGQLLTGRFRISGATGLKPGSIHRYLTILQSEHLIDMKVSNKFTIITVVNWTTYQFVEIEGEQQMSNRRATNEHIQEDKEVKKKNPSEISSEISVLVDKLFPSTGGKELFNQVRQAISSTRKRGKVSDSIILAQLQNWEKYLPGQIEAGIKTYLSKSCHLQGKDERYLLGIIRKVKPEDRPQVKSKGSRSRLLDDYYGKQGATQ